MRTKPKEKCGVSTKMNITQAGEMRLKTLRYKDEADWRLHSYLRVAVREDQLVVDRHCFPLGQRLHQQLLFHLSRKHTG